VTAFKATCLALGERFAAAVVAPQLQSAAGIPDWHLERACASAAAAAGAAPPPAAAASAAAPAAAAAAGQANGQQQRQLAKLRGGVALQQRLAAAGLLAQPVSPAQHLAGVGCALPLLLAGVLPYVGALAVSACLRRLCTDGGSGSGSSWALQHPRAFVAAVRSATEVQLVQVGAGQQAVQCWAVLGWAV
jgi:hypothetical protein